MRIQITIIRFNPEKDVTPHPCDYFIEVSRETTVLLALIKIKEEIDGSLSFRASCRAAICGSDLMMINGIQKLACQTSVLEELDHHGKLVVGPMAKVPVIKDLVVDMDPFWEKIRRVKPYVVSKNTKAPVEAAPLKTIQAALHNADACIMCGACLSACNSFEASPDFLGPAALAKAYRFQVDPRDDLKEARLEALQGEGGIWDCVRCVYCVQVCPKEVAPMEQIIRMRRKSIHSGMTDSIGARHITAFTEVVGEEGRLNETRLPMMMLMGNLKKMLGMLPLAVRMFLHKKTPPPFGAPPPGHEAVRAMFKRSAFKKSALKGKTK